MYFKSIRRTSLPLLEFLKNNPYREKIGKFLLVVPFPCFSKKLTRCFDHSNFADFQYENKQEIICWICLQKLVSKTSFFTVDSLNKRTSFLIAFLIKSNFYFQNFVHQSATVAQRTRQNENLRQHRQRKHVEKLQIFDCFLCRDCKACEFSFLNNRT